MLISAVSSKRTSSSYFRFYSCSTPGTLLINASSGKSVGDGASAGRRGEEPAEFPASGIEGSLLIFAAIIEERAAVFDHFEKVLFDRSLSQGLVVVQVADELPAQCPHIVDVHLDRLRRQIRRRQIFQERTEQGEQLLAGWQIFFQSHPRVGPT